MDDTNLPKVEKNTRKDYIIGGVILLIIVGVVILALFSISSSGVNVPAQCLNDTGTINVSSNLPPPQLNSGTIISLYSQANNVGQSNGGTQLSPKGIPNESSQVLFWNGTPIEVTHTVFLTFNGTASFPTYNGAASLEALQNGTVKWRSKTFPYPAGYVFSFIMSGTNFYLLDNNTIYDIDIATGYTKWSLNLNYAAESNLYVYKNSLYVSGLFNLTSINSNGAIAWQFSTAGLLGGGSADIEGMPLFYDNKVIIGTLNGEAYAVNLTTGKQIWQMSTGSGTPTFTYSNNTAYTSPTTPYNLYGSGSLYAINDSSGNQRWNAPICGGAEGVPIANSGKIFLLTETRPWPRSAFSHLYVFNQSTGKLLWKRILYTSSLLSVINNTAIITYTNSTNPYSPKQELVGVNGTTGSPVWSFSPGVTSLSSVGCTIGYLEAQSFNCSSANIGKNGVLKVKIYQTSLDFGTFNLEIACDSGSASSVTQNEFENIYALNTNSLLYTNATLQCYESGSPISSLPVGGTYTTNLYFEEPASTTPYSFGTVVTTVNSSNIQISPTAFTNMSYLPSICYPQTTQIVFDLNITCSSPEISSNGTLKVTIGTLFNERAISSDEYTNMSIGCAKGTYGNYYPAAPSNSFIKLGPSGYYQAKNLTLHCYSNGIELQNLTPNTPFVAKLFLNYTWHGAQGISTSAVLPEQNFQQIGITAMVSNAI